MDTDERQQLSEILADIDTSYGLLNLVRSCCCDPSGAIAPGLWEKVAGTDLRRRDEYYGDFVWFLIKSGKSIVRLLQGVGSDKISKYFAYVFGAHQDFLEDFKVALDNVKLWKVEGNEAHVSENMGCGPTNSGTGCASLALKPINPKTADGCNWIH